MTPEGTTASYERRDLSARSISALVIALFGGIALSCAAVAILFAFLPHLPTAGPWRSTTRQQPSPPGPDLEVIEGSDRPAIDAAARKRLAGYAWLDDQHDRAHIPIDRAMRLLAKKGWPDADAKDRSSP